MTEDKPTNEQNEQRGGAIPQDLIDRINELAHKKKDKGLTEEEQAEQKRLRETYLSLFRKISEVTSKCFKFTIKMEKKLLPKR